jgi:hypothetical protein
MLEHKNVIGITAGCCLKKLYFAVEGAESVDDFVRFYEAFKNYLI